MEGVFIRFFEKLYIIEYFHHRPRLAYKSAFWPYTPTVKDYQKRDTHYEHFPVPVFRYGK
ncbi:hypothetical protein DESC_570008 [Desulfosarcina cetonica]|nr:hypothetical protein DESC_570008 [Desulfosarcina cetonica]